MKIPQISSYLKYLYNFEDANVLYLDSKVKEIKELSNYKFKSISKYDKEKNYDFNDLLIVFDEKDILNNTEIINKNFKILIIGKSILNLNLKNNLRLLFQTNPFFRIFHKEINVYQRNLTEEEKLKIWNDYYGHHLEKLYDDKKLDFIFYFGHRYISKIDKKGLNIVDFGCGSGYHSNFEKLQEIRNYYFIDSNPETIRYLKNKGYTNVLQSSGDFSDISDESIDYFICSHILEHITNLKEVLNNIYKKLKKTGSIILVAPCDPGFLWNNLSKFSPNRNRLEKIGLNYNEVMRIEHVNSFTKVKKYLEENFEEKNSYYFPLFFLRNYQLNLMFFCTYSKKPKSSK